MTDLDKLQKMLNGAALPWHWEPKFDYLVLDDENGGPLVTFAFWPTGKLMWVAQG